VVVSPDELNDQLRTNIVAPMTKGERRNPAIYPATSGSLGIRRMDQLRTMDGRLLKSAWGRVAPATLARVLETLQKMFAK
jgi:mRNA interferase MazF